MASTMAIEEWRKIEGFDGYEVSSLGAVRSWRPIRNKAPVPTTPRLLRQQKDKDGYRRVVLFKDNKRYDLRIASLVCTAWHGKRGSGLEVRHLDGTKDNDTPDNLKWGTTAENAKDRQRHNTQVKGSDVNTSKLAAENVVEIRASTENVKTLAKRYGVTIGAIYHVKQKLTWKHI